MESQSLLAAVHAAAESTAAGSAPPAPPAAAAAPAPDALAQARAAGHAAGRADGVSAERARISAILSHAEAAGRGDLARHIAFSTDLSPEAAAPILAAAPKAEASAPSGLDALRASAPAITLGADARDPGAPSRPRDLSAAVERFNTARSR